MQNTTNQMNALKLLIHETQTLELSNEKLVEIANLRKKIEKLKLQIQQDAVLLESLSMRTKTPYIQFFATKQIQTSLPQSGSFIQLAGGDESEGASTAAVGAGCDTGTSAA